MYYVIIVQNEEAQTIYRYTDLNAALAAYHTELAYRAEGRTSTKCAVLDENLRLVYREEYHVEPNTEVPTEG